ncbi:hypothetical protein OEZ85_002253 [Tetradesmus obliquus]|uniref:Fucosyltransferase n=1 Tax=Tetradesmus obliquus TaxID=3088 RepID=A0ABY8U2E0_TETOB|nr:hypothetical protein OEZ85_002253 [Tetradesmus obliquus]
MVDYLADALAWAMTEGRVLLLDYQSPWTRGSPKTYCQGGALALDECYFEPVSSCSLRDAYGPEVVAAWGKSLQDGVLDAARKRLHGHKILFNAVTNKNEYSRVPPQAHPSLNKIIQGVKIGGIVSEMFWFRAVATSYLMRLNSRTLQVVNILRSHFFQEDVIGPGTVSIHIRRGDKTRIGEMRYVNESTYQSYAQALHAANTDVLNQTAFVSTEDPVALKILAGNMTSWTIQYTSVPRNNHDGKSPFATAPTTEALRAFLNLDLALECDGWVGTLGSMWSVLTERLRATVRCKADKPYADAHGTLAGLGSV